MNHQVNYRNNSLRNYCSRKLPSLPRLTVGSLLVLEILPRHLADSLFLENEVSPDSISFLSLQSLGTYNHKGHQVWMKMLYHKQDCSYK